MKKTTIAFIMILTIAISILSPSTYINAEELDDNALELFLNKLATTSEAKREFGALILEEYLADGDEGIDDLKDAADLLITDSQNKQLEENGYTLNDVKDELDRLKKWSVSDRMKIADYVESGETSDLEDLILSYENSLPVNDPPASNTSSNNEENTDEQNSELEENLPNNDAETNDNISNKEKLSTDIDTEDINNSDKTNPEKVVIKDIEFTDITNHWAKDSIEFLGSRGIIEGKDKNVFDPDSNITRAEFTALVVRLFDLKAQSTDELQFNDVESTKWYYNTVKAAYQNGVIDGMNEKEFKPNMNITREQMIAIVIRVLNKNEVLSHFETVDKNIELFTDRNEISPWAVDSMIDALKHGIIEGRSDSILAPNGNSSRAEAATIIMNVYKVLYK